MKKLYSLFFALLLAGSLAAQNPTAYFMEGSTFRSQLNPAFAPLRGYVNIPGIGSLNVSTSGNISLDKVLYPRNGKLVTLIDSSVSSAEALSGLKTQNLLGADTYINLIGFGAYARNRKDFWSFGLSLRTSAEVNLPYSLFDFIKNGHEGSIRDIGVAADSYLEAAFSYSFPLLDDRLYIGVRGKFLAGMARGRLSFDRFDVSAPGRSLGRRCRRKPRHFGLGADRYDRRERGRRTDLQIQRHRTPTDLAGRIRIRRRSGRHLRHPARPAGLAGGQ